MRIPLAFLALLLASTARAEVIGQATVIDGDTLEIHGERIRLHGIDAPESSQSCEDESGDSYRCGQQASLALADKIGDQVVSCVELDRDRYGRTVGRCTAVGEDLSEWLAFQGWAVAYTYYSYDYTRAETWAKTERRGIWRGRFVMPSDWRKGERLE